MAQKIPFFDLFKNIRLSRGLSMAVGDAYFTNATVVREKRAMELALTTSCELGESAMAELREAIRAAYSLNEVIIHLTVEAPVLDTVKPSAPAKGDKKKGEVVMGGPVRGKVQSMVGLNPKMGQVTVEGITHTTYGIGIESDEGCAVVADIATDRHAVAALRRRVAAARLSPLHLRDVVEDWLAEENHDISVGRDTSG